MARRETAVHYLLEHRLALLLAGFVLLVDQLVVDWGQTLAVGGTLELARLGPFGVGAAAPTGPFSLLVALSLGAIGVAGLLFRSARIRRSATPAVRSEAAACGSGPASELLVLAGFVAAVTNMAVRGVSGTPIVLEPLGWGLPPALLVALPAAVVLGVQRGSDRAERRLRPRHSEAFHSRSRS